MLYKCGQGEMDLPKEELSDSDIESSFSIHVWGYLPMKTSKKKLHLNESREM